MNWRIYRLPGSMQWWHIDRGEGTQTVNVLAFELRCKARSIDIQDGFPRAWIEIEFEDSELHIINGVAVFDFAGASNLVAEVLDGVQNASDTESAT